MRQALRLTLPFTIIAVLATAWACGGDEEHDRILALPEGQVTEKQYRRYARDLLLQPETPRFCELIASLDDDRVVATVRLPEDATPVASLSSSPSDVSRAAEIVRRECDRLAEEVANEQ